MIGRVEAACARYRLAATEQGLSPTVTRNRRKRLVTMEEMLARLRHERGPPVISASSYAAAAAAATAGANITSPEP